MRNIIQSHMLQPPHRKGNTCKHFYSEELQTNFVENKNTNKLQTGTLGIHMTEWATLLILETLEPLILEHIYKRLFLNLGIHENWHSFERTHRHKSKYILHYYLFMFCLSIQFKLSFIVAFVSAQKYQPNYAKCFPKIILLSSYMLNCYILILTVTIAVPKCYFDHKLMKILWSRSTESPVMTANCNFEFHLAQEWK